MLYVFLLLSILLTSAQATIPLRLVEEIHLPPRTIAWDVAHCEDSTSFGWAAITDGATVWGYNEETGEDILISPAMDTIWYMSNTEHNLEFMLFSTAEFNQYMESLSWSELTLLSLPDITGPAVAVHAHDALTSDSHFLYFIDLIGDSVLHRQTLYTEYENSYSIHSMCAWPDLPALSRRVLLSGSMHWSQDHPGCDESNTVADGRSVRLNDFTAIGLPCFTFEVFTRSDSLSFSYFGGQSQYVYDCENEDSHYNNVFPIGLIQQSGSFTITNIDTFDLWGHVTAQEDFDGTKRICFTNGNCYNATTGAIEFTNPAIADTTLSAYVRNAPGEDFLVLQSNRFVVYDGRTGVLVDSTTEIQGVPQKKFVTSGFDELLTYDAAQKLVRIYRPFETLLSIQATESGSVLLSWTPSPDATAYRLDRGEDSEFSIFFTDYIAPTITSIEFQPTASVEFFRVTPIFE